MEKTQTINIKREFQICENIINQMKKVIIGKDDVVRLLLISLISNGHVLIEDVPGVGKTTVAAALAKATGLDYKRIQLTPDVMASDITGFTALDRKSGEFVYKQGIINTNILIADEINRTSPKTQSALLEAMEERQVTVDGVTRELPCPFMVIATQNPVGFVGTYQLPEAQLDRFLIKTSMGYPNMSEEMKIINDRKLSNPLDNIHAVATIDDIIAIQSLVKKIYIDERIQKYIIELVMSTRKDSNIILAASPRASLALMRTAAANAIISGRDYCIPKDITDLFECVAIHRIILSPEAKINKMTNHTVLSALRQSVRVPIIK